MDIGVSHCGQFFGALHWPRQSKHNLWPQIANGAADEEPQPTQVVEAEFFSFPFETKFSIS